MNLSHTLVMAELLLKVVGDPAEMVQSITPEMEEPAMGDQDTIDATTETSPRTTPIAPPLHSDHGVAARHPRRDLGLNVVLAPDADIAPDAPNGPGTPNVSDDGTPLAAVSVPAASQREEPRHHLVHDIMRLAEILEKNPAIFDYLKSLTSIPAGPSSGSADDRL